MKRFPDDYKEYQSFCKGRETVGQALITSNNVGCLFTSNGYGRYVDSPEMILEATNYALSSLFELFPVVPSKPTEDGRYEITRMLPKDSIRIHSCKINSGLFRVPWDKTEEIIKYYLSRAIDASWDITWTVWEL